MTVQALLEESDSDDSDEDIGTYGGAVDAELEKFKMKAGISKYSSQVSAQVGITQPITDADVKIEVPKSQSQYAF